MTQPAVCGGNTSKLAAPIAVVSGILKSVDLSGVTEAVIIGGSGYDSRHRKNNKKLIVERDADAIAKLAALLLVRVPGAQPDYWMEPPALSVAFLADHSLVSEYGILAGWGYVRHVESDVYPLPGDYPLVNADDVQSWFRERDIDVELLSTD